MNSPKREIPIDGQSGQVEMLFCVRHIYSADVIADPRQGR
jgi:hypothetical protein